MGATQMRFWNVTSRILMGVKRVGGEGEIAVPTGGDSGRVSCVGCVWEDFDSREVRAHFTYGWVCRRVPWAPQC
jgi:hypothetical protein